MPKQPCPARPAEPFRLRSFWQTLHPGTSLGSNHGLLGGSLLRVLQVPARARLGLTQPNKLEIACYTSSRPNRMTLEQTFSLSCPFPIQNYPNVLMAHGGGGKLMHQLIAKMIVP